MESQNLPIASTSTTSPQTTTSTTVTTTGSSVESSSVPVTSTTGTTNISSKTHPSEKPNSQNPGVEENDSNAEDTESLDSNSSKRDVSPRVPRNTSRGVTMQTLLQEGVLESGPGVLSIDYLGEKYIGDLLSNGKILWETKQFPSPSSWATFIKKKVNPSKKSGCGWNSVKYKGKKLDKLKSGWIRKNNPTLATRLSPATNFEDDNSSQASNMFNDKASHDRKLIKYSELKHQNVIDPNIFIEYEHFDENAGKPQPFSVVIYASVFHLIDFHCHLTTSEMVGYLGGKWDVNKKCMYILEAFPCRCKNCDQEAAGNIEQEIRNKMMMYGLLRVGWYHSHPTTHPTPTLRDVDVQYELQMMTNNTHPSIGLICTPYDSRDSMRTEPLYGAFWVLSPPELAHEPMWCGIPMKISYSEMNEISFNPNLLNEMRLLMDYYKQQPDVIDFNKVWNGHMTFVDKIKLSMQRKLLKDQTCNQLMQYIQGLLTNVDSTATS